MTELKALKRYAALGLVTVFIGLMTSSAQTRSQPTPAQIRSQLADPDAMLCQVEHFVTTRVSRAGNIESTTETGGDEVEFSKLHSDSPSMGGYFGYSAGLKVLKRTPKALWMAEFANENVNLITLFGDTKIVMYTNQKVVGAGPVGFVGIGKCKPLL
jgi:hypothetical protein